MLQRLEKFFVLQIRIGDKSDSVSVDRLTLLFEVDLVWYQPWFTDLGFLIQNLPWFQELQILVVLQ